MKPYYYVFRISNKYMSSKISSEDAADIEAKRLSAQYPGETFEILKSIAITQSITVESKTFWLE